MAEDISPEIIKKTQKLLGKYVKKPALTEKLLKKPPFRFLHDIVVAVIKDTGFLKGLFSAQELLSENIKDKEAKVAFLNKLIDAIKTITKADLTVRASKIVAGLEPTKTNLLLQAMGKAIDDKIDTSAYIAQLNSGLKDTTEKKKLKKSTPIKDDKGKTSKIKNKDDSNTKTTKTKKSTESPRSNSKASTPKESSRGGKKVSKASKNESIKQGSIEEETRSEMSKLEIVTDVTPQENTTTSNAIIDGAQTKAVENLNMLNDQTKVDDQNGGKEHIVKATENQSSLSKDSINLEVINKEQKDAMNQNVNVKEIKNDTQNLARPKSARPKNIEGNTLKPKKLSVAENEAPKPLQMTATQVQRPKSSLRPPTVRPSSARPGAPRLRPDSALPVQENVMMGNINVIIENVDNMDDEETVVIQTTPDVVEENFNPTDVAMDNKGQLVEQILEQIQGEDGEGVKKKVDIDWEQDALHNKDGTTKEINQLRSLIQTLTKTANPLGKLLNYLHEDIEAMFAELQMWKNIKKQLYGEISKQQRNDDDLHKNLETQLDRLVEDVILYRHNISVTHKNILRNELRIKELLTAQLLK